MNARFENFTTSILKIYKLIQKIKLREMESFGLRAIHVMCVSYLEENRDGLTAGELVRLTLEDKAAISRALGTLRDDGYIEYITRSYNSKARLTDKGVDLARLIDERMSLAVDDVGEGFLPDETNTMYRLLDTITERLESYYDRLQDERNL